MPTKITVLLKSANENPPVDIHCYCSLPLEYKLNLKLILTISFLYFSFRHLLLIHLDLHKPLKDETRIGGWCFSLTSFIFHFLPFLVTNKDGKEIRS